MRSKAGAKNRLLGLLGRRGDVLLLWREVGLTQTRMKLLGLLSLLLRLRLLSVRALRGLLVEVHAR